MAGRKVFVGSLPPMITGDLLKEVFGKYGTVEDTYVKPGCEPGRQWAFVTFSTPQEAQHAKECCDRQVTFPGSEGPCDVMFAKTRMGGKGGGGAPAGPHVVAPPQDYAAGAFDQPAANGGPYVVAPPQDYGAAALHQPAANGGPYVVAPPQDYGAAAFQQPAANGYATAQASGAARKVFVGSLPGNITDDVLRAEFTKYGAVEDIYIKPNCEPGRQWAFVHFASPEEATYAASVANGIVQFEGCIKPCEVTLARNQGLFGQEPLNGAPAPQAQPQVVYAPAAPQPTEAQTAPRKIFVGSLPDGITDPALRAEFAKFGTITDLYMKNNCEPGRHWAFITFATHEEALYAKESCDRVLQFPNAERPCEVTIARHQGMFGQGAVDNGHQQAAPVQYSAGGNYSATGATPYATPAPSLVDGPRKVFVGSLPDTIDDSVLRAEFGKYGQILDLFIKKDIGERNRQWAFVTFATAEQAAFAKESTDQVLLLPGADRACEVMLAKNQGKFGQAPLGTFGVGRGAQPVAVAPVAHAPAAAPAVAEEAQPPPPATPPPSHLTAWRMYRTASGIPYYYNATTGITQWECPPDLQVPGQPPGQPPANAYEEPAPAAGGQQRYSPY